MLRTGLPASWQRDGISRGFEMTDILNDLQAMRQLDAENTLDRMAEMSLQCRLAWQRVNAFRLPYTHRAATSVVISGLGGSAIGGDLARSLAQAESRIPIVVHRDYGLPAFAGKDTLVIACSYSGGTEETLSAFEEGHRRGCHLLALTPGGELAARAAAVGAPVLDYQYKSQPRAAMGFSLVLLLGILWQMGDTHLTAAHIDDTCVVLDSLLSEVGPDVPLDRNPAKQMAKALHGKLPVIYAPDFLGDVARRYKTQINENSKGWAFFEVLPELNHNAVVGYQFPQAFAEQFVIVSLTSSFNHPRNLLRVRAVYELLKQSGVQYFTVEGRGQYPMSHLFSLVRFGDYLSYYLAMLNEVDPTPVPTIAFLKDWLARS
jgi:glucose/mannose-6-phosphate isomerase